MLRRSSARSVSCYLIPGLALLVIGVFVLAGGCPQPSSNTTNNTGNNSDNSSNSNTTDNTGSNNNTGTSDTTDGNSSSTDNTGSNTSDNTSNNTDNSGTSNNTPTYPTSITLSQIVQTGDAVPDQSSGATFTAFGSPIVDGDGRIAFWATFTGGTGNGGLYVYDSGTLKCVVDDNPARVGTVPKGDGTIDAAEYYGPYLASFNPLQLVLTWGSAGRLLFGTPVAGGYGENAIFRWRASDANIIRVADSAMVSSTLGYGTTGQGFISNFPNFGVSDAGLVFFRTKYTSLQPLAMGSAVCTSNGTKVKVVKKPGSVTPDLPSGYTFTEFRDLTTLSPGGNMLFQGKSMGGGDDVYGLYVSVAGAAALRVIDNRASLTVPGLPENAQIGTPGAYYAAMAAGANNHIAVQTPITASGTTHNAVIIFDWNASPATWAELTTSDGTPATALLTGVTSDGFVAILAGGKPYFASRAGATDMTTSLPTALTGVDLTWGSTGGAANDSGHALVWYTRTGTHIPCLAFWTGAAMLVVADPAASLPSADVTTIKAASVPENDRPGRSGLLNDHDLMVFHVTGPSSHETIYSGQAQ